MSYRLYRIHVVAELVGVSENLLRVWERRHGIVTPTRGPSGYRAYTEEDVALLKRVKALTREGMAIGDVARILPGLREAARAELATAGAPDNLLPLPQGREAAWREALLDAAHALDQAAAERTLQEACAHLPPVAAFERVMAPALRELGEQWHAGRLTVAQEHLASHAIRAQLLTLLATLPRARGPRALCACFPDDEHEAGLLGAALRLREAGLDVTWLGARTPVAALLDAASRLEPDVVALSSTLELPAEAFAHVLDAVVRGLPRRTTVLVGGRGAEGHARLVSSLGATLASAGPLPFLATGAPVARPA